MKVADKERGANVRRNLRRWWKPLVGALAGWVALTTAVCIGAITYAHRHHFSESRVQALAENCAAVMSVLLILGLLIALVLADRQKPM